MGRKFKLASLVFTSFVFLLIAGAVWTSKDWDPIARAFPWFLAIPGLVLASLQLLIEIVSLFTKGVANQAKIMDTSIPTNSYDLRGVQRTRRIFYWLGAFIVFTWLLGLFISPPLFVLLFLRFEAREKWWVAVACAAVVLAFMVGFLDRILHVPWIPGALFGALGF